MNKRELGAAGETAALKYYIAKGYALVSKNWRYRRFGEIDFILSGCGAKCENKHDLLVFCEVKLRNKKSFLTPAEAVNITKQNRIRKLAEIFISINPQFENYIVRFDIAELYYDESLNYRVRILEEAF
ncbi:MAG: YraN family protein [Clostridia bacterium]|nr:YraN family protein [Clostridia bacterium]